MYRAPAGRARELAARPYVRRDWSKPEWCRDTVGAMAAEEGDALLGGDTPKVLEFNEVGIHQPLLATTAAAAQLHVRVPWRIVH